MIDKELDDANVEIGLSAVEEYRPVLDLMAALERGLQVTSLQLRTEESPTAGPDPSVNPTQFRAASHERMRRINTEPSRRERNPRPHSRTHSRPRGRSETQIRTDTHSGPDDDRRHDEQTRFQESVDSPVMVDTWEPRDRVEALETLLVLRAVLYATLLSTAIDSSDILEMKTRDEIVRIL